MEKAKIKYAFFDLDYTLLKKDCTLVFLQELIKIKPVTIFNIIKTGFYVLPLLLKIIDMTRFKEIFFKPLAKIDKHIIKSLVNSVADKCINKYLKKGVKEYIVELKEKDFVIAIISASPDLYVCEIAKRLGADICLATKLKYNSEKVWIEGKNCKHIEKVKRIQNIINIDTIDKNLSVAYSDSKTDIPMLKLTSNGYIVYKYKWKNKSKFT